MSPWVRLDDTFDDDPRIVTVGPGPTGLLVACLCWNNRTLADGFVPEAVVRQKAGEDGKVLLDELVGVGLLARAKRGGMTGFQIHDDLVKHQPSRGKVEADRLAARARKDEWRERVRHAKGTLEEHRSPAVLTSQECGPRTLPPTRPDPGPIPDPDPIPVPDEHHGGIGGALEGPDGEPFDPPDMNDPDLPEGPGPKRYAASKAITKATAFESVGDIARRVGIGSRR